MSKRGKAPLSLFSLWFNSAGVFKRGVSPSSIINPHLLDKERLPVQLRQISFSRLLSLTGGPMQLPPYAGVLAQKTKYPSRRRYRAADAGSMCHGWRS